MTRSSRTVDTKYLSFPCKAIPGWSTDSLLIDILEKSNSGEKQFQRHGVCLSKGYVRVTSGDCLFKCHAKRSREMFLLLLLCIWNCTQTTAIFASSPRHGLNQIFHLISFVRRITQFCERIELTWWFNDLMTWWPELMISRSQSEESSHYRFSRNLFTTLMTQWRMVA